MGKGVRSSYIQKVELKKNIDSDLSNFLKLKNAWALEMDIEKIWIDRMFKKNLIYLWIITYRFLYR